MHVNDLFYSFITVSLTPLCFTTLTVSKYAPFAGSLSSVSLGNYHLISLGVSPSAIEAGGAEMHYRKHQKYVIRVNTGQHVD